MPDTPSITLVKRFTYRGKPEEFSNKYHFKGTVPTTEAGWKALADAWIDIEALFCHTDVSFVRAYGYEAGNELSVAQIDYEAAPNVVKKGASSMAADGLVKAQPETAITVRWRTAERNSRKKWIYLRKYYHGVGADSSGDSVPGVVLTKLQQQMPKLTNGTLPGGVKYCGPQGADAGAPQINPYFTTRELKRRGKRPSR